MTEPLFLRGAVKDYLWGGEKLIELFGKKGKNGTAAESWELSCHEDGPSVIENTKDSGLTLPEYIAKYGIENVLGKGCHDTDILPLIKLIDAKEPLSVQVHPDNSYARKHGFSNGKTEMWYILDADEGAEIVYGVNRSLTKEEFRQYAESGNLSGILRYIPVKKGDVFFIPSGTLHAIGAGILLAEVQQNSNVTYRVWDYGRTDSDGNRRELHIDDAVRCASLEPADEHQQCCDVQSISNPWGKSRIICECNYFVTVIEELSGDAVWEHDASDVYRHLLITEGGGTLYSGGRGYPVRKGDSIMLPASCGDCCIDGEMSFLSTLFVNAEE